MSFVEAEEARRLAKRLGVYDRHLLPMWVTVVSRALARHGAQGRRKVMKAARRLVGSPELQQALEALARLGDAPAVTRWLTACATDDQTPEQVAALREKRLRDLVAKRASHTRAKLEEWEAELARVERIVAKWRKKAAYYDRTEAKAFTLDGDPVDVEELLDGSENEGVFSPDEKSAIRAMLLGDVREIGAGGASVTFELKRTG